MDNEELEITWTIIPSSQPVSNQPALTLAGVESVIPSVDEIAEATADARLWKGSWKDMGEPERDVFRQGAEGVYKLLQKRLTDSFKEGFKEGQLAQHLKHCGWCRQGLECPYKFKNSA